MKPKPTVLHTGRHQGKRRNRPPKWLRDFRANPNARQAALTEYARRHNLTCTTCNTKDGPWANTGQKSHSPQIVCTTCKKR